MPEAQMEEMGVRGDAPDRLKTVGELRAAGWKSKSVKREVRDNMIAAIRRGDELFPGIVGYDDTVVPEVVNAVLAESDILLLGEKGQAKSRIMRLLTRFLDDAVPYLDCPEAPVHEDPYHPITTPGRRMLAELGDEAPIRWWDRRERYAERLAPGTKFADLIGEIDPARILSGSSMSAEEALHFGLIPRMHRGVFAMNELPDLDDLVQVGLFNILEERDVQIRGYPVSFDIDVLVLFSANPATYNRSGKVIPQLKDRIGATIQTHYPRERDLAIEITRSESGIDLGDPDAPKTMPVLVPRFMEEVVEQVSAQARRSRYVDQSSGVSARFSIALYKMMIANARRRGLVLDEWPVVPRMSDLAHIEAAGLGKLELDLMGTHQMTERQVLEALLAEAVGEVFEEYADEHGLAEIGEIFGKGVRVEVGDMLPSSHYAERLKRVPPVWDKAFEVNASQSEPVRASCVEFVLAGLHARDIVSRAARHGRIEYET